MQKEREISTVELDGYMSAIEGSGVLGRSPRRIRLLRHLVQSEILGQGATLKAYSIGLDIFGKDEDFDPASDSTVRVEIGRLRTAIELFEASDHADTALVVEIPVGTYRPTLTRRAIENTVVTAPLTPSHDTMVVPKRQGRSFAKTIPILAGLIFAVGLVAAAWAIHANRQTPPDQPAIAVNFDVVEPRTDDGNIVAVTLQAAFSKSPTVSVVTPLSDEQAQNNGFRIVANSFFQTDGLWVQIDLLQSQISGGRVLWSKMSFVPRGENVSEFVVNREFVRELGVRLFAASLERLEASSIDALSPAALFVMSTWVPGVGARSTLERERNRIALA